MSDAEPILRLGKNVQRMNISTGTTGKSVEKSLGIRNDQVSNDAAAYSKNMLMDEQKKLFQAFMAVKPPDSQLDDRLDQNVPDPVYGKYKFDNTMQTDAPLPIIASRNEILHKIATNPVVVIEGDTGCGKSTQLPQMILDDCHERNQRCNIIVTQPRRLAARTIAERVSWERKWELGTLVGYQIALDTHYVSDDTRILFCTTGLLLEKLMKTKTLSNYTHIILDEVHERDKNMDFLFIIIRMLLCNSSSNVKIILMSATIEAPKFAEYFKLPVGNDLMPAPVIQIDQKTQYSVDEFYLDDISRYSTGLTIDFEKPSICDEMYEIALKLVVLMKTIDESDTDQLPYAPSILIFLPGINEINALHTVLSDYVKPRINDLKWKILVLHSLMSLDQQHMIYRDVDPDVRKIILSTNIAESSLTVPNVKYVIDFCLTKSMQTDSATNFASLCMGWASRSNLRQRAGRAGRVMNGRCFRLITRYMYEYYLEQSAQPELLRSPLENIVLKTKMLDMGAPLKILALAMDPPKPSNVANTILVLKELGAMLHTVNGKKDVHDGDITFMGIVMANLPVDVRVSRLIILGYLFSVLEESVIMAAGLNVKSIFTQSIHDGLGAYSRKLEWSNGTGSDLFAIYNAYKVWSVKHNQKDFGETPHERRQGEKQFGQKHCIEIRSLYDCHLLVNELKQRLSKLGIDEPMGVNRVVWDEQQKTIILKIVIGGAFYPNLFLRSTPEGQTHEHDVFKTLNGRDPHTTVYYKGFSDQHIRELYTSSIKKLFGNAIVDRTDMRNVKVSFAERGERVFVTFEQPKNGNTGEHWMTKRSKIPGKIAIEVYKALKMRLLRMPQSIQVMKPNDAAQEAAKLGLGFIDDGRFVRKQNAMVETKLTCLPRIKEKMLRGKISHIENCERFWFQPKREDERIRNIFKILNSVPGTDVDRTLTEFEDTGDTIDTITVIAARDKRKDTFYRARILSANFSNSTESLMYNVLYIDYGHTGLCERSELRRFINHELLNLPPRCFQCRLAEVHPAITHSETNEWTQDATNTFIEMIDDVDGQITAEIYSVVNGVAHVIVYANQENINEQLIEKGFADICEENYMSKENRVRRQHKQSLVMEYDDDDEMESQDVPDDFPDAEVPVKYSQQRVVLRGPFSPLETTLQSTMHSAQSKTISSDPLSVNSIMLDNDLHDPSCKYVVAASINQTDLSAGHLTIRETTLMPNIRGIGPLIALLFCPMMELQRDQTNTRFISFISGLGYNKIEKCPIFEEHDSIFHLDVELTQDDFSIINQLRYCFDTLLYTLEGQEQNRNLSAEKKVTIMIKIKELILKLLTTKRNPMELHTDHHTWNQYNPAVVIRPEKVYENRSIFPAHNTLKLSPRNVLENCKLRKQCRTLHDIAKEKVSVPLTLKCQLCAMEFDNIVELRVHLICQLHLNREKQIEFNRV